jgi:Astacin (Peptidase family M12A)
MQNAVRRAFTEWKGLGIGLTFEEVSKPAGSMLRITFQNGLGSYSIVGTDNLQFPSEETMNFGWDITGSEFATALHEVGHALGLQVS